MFFKYFPNYISIINKILIFFSLYPPTPVSTFPPAILPLSSGPWVTCVSSLASPFRILFLTSPCLFCSCQLCFLSPAPFSPLSPSPLPADNPLNDPRTYAYVPVLVVCLVCFCFYFLDSVVDSCEFVIILMFIVLIFNLIVFSLYLSSTSPLYDKSPVGH